MKFQSRPVITAMSLAIIAVPCLAQGGKDNRPPVLKALEARGVTPFQEFKTGSEVRGFAGAMGQDPVAVYVTKDGSAIVGTRIDAQGAAVDTKAIDDLVTKPMGEAAWQKLEKTKWVRDGRDSAPRVVYVITDANCPWCHRLWEAARPWIDSGRVQVRNVFVGVIRADSGAKAAAILEASNPSEALERNERTFDKGGVAPLKKVSATSTQMLESNLQLMNELGFRGTPGIVYRSPDGKVQMLGGFPRGNQLTEVFGPR